MLMYSRYRLIMVGQLLATALVLALVPGNLTKLLVMVPIWLIGFWPLSRVEGLVALGVNALFVVLNLGALSKGVFAFDHPSLLGMPAYEFAMWGFYTLHVMRMIGGQRPRGRRVCALILAVLFAIPFSAISQSDLLLLSSGSALIIALAFFHDPLDLAYAGYMLVVGAIIEYVGVGAGQWHYPGAPHGGVPLWFVTMWAGVGLFTRRLLVPLLQPPSSRDAATL